MKPLKTTFPALFYTGNADIKLVQFCLSFLNLMDKLPQIVMDNERNKQTHTKNRLIIKNPRLFAVLADW